MKKGLLIVLLLALLMINCQIYSGFSDQLINNWYFNNGDNLYRYYDDQEFYTGTKTSFQLSVKFISIMRNAKIKIYDKENMNLLHYLSFSNVGQIHVTVALPPASNILASIKILDEKNYEHSGVGTWSCKNNLF